MNLCHDFDQVLINTTAGGQKVLLAASGTRVPCLNRLHVSSTSATKVLIKSTGTQLDRVGLIASTPLIWPMEPRVLGCLRGLKGKNITISATAGVLDGFAVVSWCTVAAT